MTPQRRLAHPDRARLPSTTATIPCRSAIKSEADGMFGPSSGERRNPSISQHQTDGATWVYENGSADVGRRVDGVAVFSTNPETDGFARTCPCKGSSVDLERIRQETIEFDEVFASVFAVVSLPYVADGWLAVSSAESGLVAAPAGVSRHGVAGTAILGVS